MLSLNIKGFEPGEACAVLDQAFDIKARAGLHCAPAAHRTFGTFPAGTIRLSPGYFNTTDEIDFTLEAFKKISLSLKKGKKKIEDGLKDKPIVVSLDIRTLPMLAEGGVKR